MSRLAKVKKAMDALHCMSFDQTVAAVPGIVAMMRNLYPSYTTEDHRRAALLQAYIGKRWLADAHGFVVESASLFEDSQVL